MRILLVEDTPSLAAEIVDILRMEDFDVSIAKNGVDALGQLRSRLANIVISDLFMPEMDGFQLIMEVKKDASLKHIPIVILSARTTIDAIEKVKELGADLFIAKPCDSKYLVGSIRQILQRNNNNND
ncbi:MAG TPA: response regulator [Chryseolinea sp.]|nr:response regulator [Chryseolinea sp.]